MPESNFNKKLFVDTRRIREMLYRKRDILAEGEIDRQEFYFSYKILKEIDRAYGFSFQLSKSYQAPEWYIRIENVRKLQNLLRKLHSRRISLKEFFDEIGYRLIESYELDSLDDEEI